MLKKYISEIKKTFTLAVPVIIGQLGHVLLGITDSAMVGRVGSDQLAASSLVNGIFFLLLVLGIGISIAVTPLVAMAKGGNNHEECGILLRQSLLVNIFFSIIFTGLVFIASYFLEYLNQPEEVVLLAGSYMRIIGFSIIPFMLFQTYRQFIEGLSFTKPAMYIAIISNVVNVFGNWILIYGKLGMPALGLDGAGYASLITRLFMAIALFSFVVTNKHFKEYDPTLRFKNINWPIIRKLINLGVPSGFTAFFEVFAFSFSSIMMGWISSNALAAHQIGISFASISFMIILGISAASTIRVGTAMGKKDFDSLKPIGFSSIMFSSILMSSFGIIFIAFRNYLPWLFVVDTEVIEIAASLLVIAAFFQISDGVQAVGLGLLRGITDVKIPMIATFIAYWVISLPVGYIIAFKYEMGAIGIWIGLLLGLTLVAIFFTLRFNYKIEVIKNEHS
ncbi:MAG: MATE family efflux transporter [Melioribacteraceae bacterium]|nr:MATE family efflux transporter [Melioribacteraceae bacterium]